VKVEHNACTRERLDREQPRECDGCDGSVSLADIKPCINAKSYWVEVEGEQEWWKRDRARVANRI
jgi:hypothetical protein